MRQTFVLLMLLAASGCRESLSPTDPGAAGTHSIVGQVVSAEDGAPLAGVRVDAYVGRPPVKSTVTDGDGRFRLADLKAGTYTIAASKTGLAMMSYLVHIDDLTFEVRRDFVLHREVEAVLPAYELFGMTWVKGSEGRSAWVGATVEVLDGPQAGLRVESDEMGMYSLRPLQPGTIRVRASKADRSETIAVEMRGQAPTIFVNFSF